jgi:hypothetical protein
MSEEFEQQYEEEQPRMEGRGTPFYQPMIMPSEKSDLYDKIRPEEVIETVKYLFMGYQYDKMKQQWILNPLMSSIALSEVGANHLTTLLFPVSNKSVSISKLTDNEIRERTKSLNRTAMRMCLYYWYEYGIKSPATLFYVKEVILSISFITLKQPEDAGVRKFIQGSTQENKIIQEQPKKEGGFSAMFRR